MTRLTPFQYVFGEQADEWFGDVRRQALVDHVDTTDRGQFAAFPRVQRLLAQIEQPELLERVPAAAAEYITQLYVAFRFWEAGAHIYAVDDQALAAPNEQDAAGCPPIVIPHGACYFQLAPQRFWAQIDPDAPHEPVDGVFVADSIGNRELTAVAVLGLRPERQGFSQIAMAIAHADMATILADMRHTPFAPTMDGGDQAGFRSIASPAELLLLVSLACRQVAATPSQHERGRGSSEKG